MPPFAFLASTASGFAFDTFSRTFAPLSDEREGSGALFLAGAGGETGLLEVDFGAEDLDPLLGTPAVFGDFAAGDFFGVDFEFFLLGVLEFFEDIAAKFRRSGVENQATTRTYARTGAMLVVATIFVKRNQMGAEDRPNYAFERP